MLTRSNPAIKPVVSAARQNYNARVKYGFYFGEACQPENIDLPEINSGDMEVSDESNTVVITDKSETIICVKDSLNSKSDNRLENLRTVPPVLPNSRFRKRNYYSLYDIQSVYDNTIVTSSCRAGPLVYLQGHIRPCRSPPPISCRVFKTL